MSLRWPVPACPDVFTGSGQPVLPAPVPQVQVDGQSRVQRVQVVAPATKRFQALLQFGCTLAWNGNAAAHLAVGTSILLILYLVCHRQEVDGFF
jgi:hypothetical protein